MRDTDEIGAKEVARLLGCSVDAVWRNTRLGKIPARRRRTSRRYVYSRREVLGLDEPVVPPVALRPAGVASAGHAAAREALRRAGIG